MSSSACTITCGIQYWTFNDRQCQIPEDNLSAFCYYDKESKKQDGARQKSQKIKGQYYHTKQQYVESRGGTWILPNKRPERLKDSIKELEEILKSHKILHVKWNKRNSLQIIVHSGLLINILLSENCDIQKIFFDKSLLTKIQPDFGPIGAAYLTDRFLILCLDEANKLCFISFVQRPATPNQKQLSSKLSSMDMKISYHDIPGFRSMRGNRKLCVNKAHNLAICWSTSHTTPSTWTSTDANEEKANMILLGSSFGRLEIYSSIYTESNPIHVEFSRKNENQVHSLERSVTAKNEIVLHYAVYECTQSKLQRLEVTQIPVKSGILSSDISREEDKIVVGCTDGTVLVFDTLTKTTSSIRDSLIPSIVSWHPNGGVILVASGSAELQCYDCALGKLSTALLDEIEDSSMHDMLKLSKYLPSENGLVSLTWPDFVTETQVEATSTIKKSSVCHDVSLVLFDGGPLAILKFNVGVLTKGLLRPIEVVKEHITHDKIEQAVQVLHTINWNTDCTQAFLAMTSILNHLLKQKLNFECEELLEAALSAFYTPRIPLAQTIVVEYRHIVSRYARRFYHHLLRFKRFDKAFLLAKDIQDYDLFVDLYFSAKESGELVIAKAAKQKIFELYSSSEDEDSVSDDESEPATIDGRRSRSDFKRRGSSTKRITHIVKRRNKPFKATSPRIRKEIVPPSYPPPRMDDFMKSLISETRAVLENKSTLPKDPIENLPANVSTTGSSLRILDYGYV
uniref:WD repeat-containing and planar cell polarity effector protein fritz homolog n=1 Tax=Styela clava TaxID=7725 RepID=UPI001939676F|nr:WD repeat-containing and planar cell polarity effector protein fritz homolog [Styela clava]